MEEFKLEMVHAKPNETSCKLFLVTECFCAFKHVCKPIKTYKCPAVYDFILLLSFKILLLNTV